MTDQTNRASANSEGMPESYWNHDVTKLVMDFFEQKDMAQHRLAFLASLLDRLDHAEGARQLIAKALGDVAQDAGAGDQMLIGNLASIIENDNLTEIFERDQEGGAA